MLNQPNYNKEKPKTLYRGVIINYQLLKDFQFYGVDLVPPNKPLVDENGRKTVGDGNEYGVYMTDHEVVARKAYAAVEVNDGMPIKKDVFFGYDRSRTVIPSIGIVYRIDTEGIDVHIPWITSQLQGHYNNGMGGDEWIAESIPASNYSIDTIEIGPDTLHDSEFIKITDITTIKQKLIDIINQRKERLELFENKIETMPINERLLLDESKIQILKSIYRLKGIMDIDINNYNPQSSKEYMDYLMAVVYIKNKEDIDYKTLTYIKSLKDRVKKDTTIDEIIERVNKEIKRNEEKRAEFIEKKRNLGEKFSTVSFDKKNEIYKEILTELENKINCKSQSAYSREEKQTIADTQKLGKETLDMQQDTETLDNVEKQIEEQEFEINQSGEIIRKGKTTGRFNLSGTTSEYVTQTLNEFMQNLENGNYDEESKKKKDDDFKVEKGDDDYIR